MGITVESTVWLFSPLFPVRIGNWKCWFLWREENRSTRRKTLGAETRTNNKLNPHMTSTSFNIRDNKRNVEQIFKQSLKAFKLIQHRFNSRFQGSGKRFRHCSSTKSDGC